MRQVRTQKRHKRLVTLVAAVITASALLSASQPALAVPIPIVDSGRAWGHTVQQGDFEISVSVFEDLGGGALCAHIRRIQGEEHGGCIDGAAVDVSDTLESARGRGTKAWSTSAAGKGRYKTTYKYGTVTADVTWTGTGDTNTNLDPGYIDPGYIYGNCSFPGWDGGGCYLPEPHLNQRRAATWSGTITDSEWGTFVVNGARGSLYQSAF